MRFSQVACTWQGAPGPGGAGSLVRTDTSVDKQPAVKSASKPTEMKRDIPVLPLQIRNETPWPPTSLPLSDGESGTAFASAALAASASASPVADWDTSAEKRA